MTTHQTAGSTVSFLLEPIEMLPTRLERYLSRDGRGIIPSHFAKILLALTGALIEGREPVYCILAPFPGTSPDLSRFGVAITPPLPVPEDFVRPWVPGTRQHYAEHIRSLRAAIGRVGDAVDLTAVLDNRGGIARLLLLREGVSPRDLSAVGDVIWIHPRGSMWIFSEGQDICHVLKLRDGTGWTVRDVRENERSFVTSFEGSLSGRQSMQNVLRASWLASSQDCGMALFLLTCGSREYRRYRDMPNSVIATGMRLTTRLCFRTPRELLRLGLLDGGTLVAEQGGTGQIIDAGVYFKAPGGRHNSASFVVNNTPWVDGAIVVSQDGPISWYKKDHRGVIGGDTVRFL